MLVNISSITGVSIHFSVLHPLFNTFRFDLLMSIFICLDHFLFYLYILVLAFVHLSLSLILSLVLIL